MIYFVLKMRWTCN